MKILFSLLLTFSVLGAQKKVSHANYDEALKARDVISFDMESTKAGLITTGFTGVAKTFTVDYERAGNTFKNVTISVLVSSLDTDIDDRNEKMHELCFDYKKFDKIVVRLKSDYQLDSPGDYKASILIRGKWFDMNLSLHSSVLGEKIQIYGSSSLSLKALSIPDPSIWIATVRDLVELKFKIEL